MPGSVETPLDERAVAPGRAISSSRLAHLAAIGAIALLGLFAALTEVNVVGHWQGLFLLRGRSGPRLELKDDLFLGDGSRVIASLSFSRARRLLAGGAGAEAGKPWLELDWDEAGGGGIVRNHLPDGTELVTLFGRYEDSQSRTPQGLFVGGAIPDVAADEARANQSGMAHRDSRGWHHVWCNVNEAIFDVVRRQLSYPSAWKLLGTRVLIGDRDRLVIESSHELAISGGPIRMDRFAYFRAGKPWFKLGIQITNTGDDPIHYAYTYGDEPWVGDFGSAAGNVGWTAEGYVRTEEAIDPVANRWAGVLDEDSGVANFIAWVGGDLPDLVYLANAPGALARGARAPLDSNEIFLGLEWSPRILGPGESRSMLLSLGLAEIGRTGLPAIPAGAGPP